MCTYRNVTCTVYRCTLNIKAAYMLYNVIKAHAVVLNKLRYRCRHVV